MPLAASTKVKASRSSHSPNISKYSDFHPLSFFPCKIHCSPTCPICCSFLPNYKYPTPHTCKNSRKYFCTARFAKRMAKPEFLASKFELRACLFHPIPLHFSSSPQSPLYTFLTAYA